MTATVTGTVTAMETVTETATETKAPKQRANGAATSRSLPFELSLPLAIALVVFLGAYLWIARVGMNAFPNSGDEYSYLLQAQLFASGRIAAPSLPPEIAKAFMMDHVIDDGTVRSKYPPGWPVLLALGELARFPWAVNPLLAVLTLWLTFQITLRLVGRIGAWCALLSLGLGPMFVVQAGSFYSQTSSLCLLAAYLLLLVIGLERMHGRAYVGAGFAAGFGVLTRPFETLVFGLGALPLVRLGPRRLALVAAGAIPCALAFLAYNDAAFGSPLTTGYDAYTTTFRQLYRPGYPLISLSNATELRAHLNWFHRLATWSTPGFALLLPLGAWLLWQSAGAATAVGRHLVLSLVVQLVAMQFIYPPGDLAYGPRYLFAGVLPGAVMTGAACEHIVAALGPRVRSALIAGGVAALLWSGVLVHENLFRIASGQELRRGIYERVAQARLEHAVVFMDRMPDFPISWYVRNGPDFEGKVIYAIAGDRERNTRVLQHFPGYRAFLYLGPTPDAPARLEPIR